MQRRDKDMLYHAGIPNAIFYYMVHLYLRFSSFNQKTKTKKTGVQGNTARLQRGVSHFKCGAPMCNL